MAVRNVVCIFAPSLSSCNINVTFDVLFRAETLKKLKFPPEMFLIPIRQIVHGLRLDAIRHEYYAWRSQNSQPAVQIDLVIDRADGIVTICEMKYSKDDYTLSEKEYRNIVRRMETFQKETGHKGGIQVSLVTTYGLHENMYSEISPVPITIEELFLIKAQYNQNTYYL